MFSNEQHCDKGCAQAFITCDHSGAPIWYYHCEHCDCDFCIVDAIGKKGDLVVDLEAEQRGPLGCDSERQLSPPPNKKSCLFPRELSSSVPSRYEDFQPEFLETSEAMDFDISEAQKKRLLVKAIKEAYARQTYGPISVVTLPKGNEIIAFDHEGKEDFQSQAREVGRPIGVSVSSDSVPQFSRNQSKSNGSSVYSSSSKYRRFKRW